MQGRGRTGVASYGALGHVPPSTSEPHKLWLRLYAWFCCPHIHVGPVVKFWEKKCFIILLSPTSDHDCRGKQSGSSRASSMGMWDGMKTHTVSFVQQTGHAQVAVATINGWRPRLRRRCTPPLEQSAGMRHLCEITIHFQETFKNSAF